MTYGALVVQLVQDYEDYTAVNAALLRMGSSIGTRLVEDFLARSQLGRCADFRETGEVIAKVSIARLCVLKCIITSWMFMWILNTGSIQVFPEHHS